MRPDRAFNWSCRPAQFILHGGPLQQWAGRMNVCSLLWMFLAVAVAGCTLAPQRDALDVARRYSEAISSGDVDALVQLTEPEVLKRVPVEDFRKLLTSLLVERDENVLSIRDEIGAVSEMFVDETGMHFFVENRRTTTQKDDIQVEVDNFYLLTSRDFGRSWRVLDNSCVDEAWIRGIAPGWTGNPAAPRQDVRTTQVAAKILGKTPLPPPRPSLK